VSAQAPDADAFLGQLLAENARARAAAIARTPKLPKPSYRQRRAEWAALGKTGEDARAAMEQELEREPYRPVVCGEPDCPVCGA
jgi:hypothetical protein